MDSQYDNFKEALLNSAAFSPDAYSDARRVINEEDPVSSAKLYFDEMVLKAKNGGAMLPKRRGYGRRADDSSEDEGEIVENLWEHLIRQIRDRRPRPPNRATLIHAL